MRTELLLFSTSIAILPILTYAQRFDAQRIFQHCAPAVVYIETEDKIGAGFFVSPQHIVTNKHVIERTTWLSLGPKYYTRREITVQLRSGQRLSVAEVNPFSDHPDIDLAVLKVQGYHNATLPIKPSVANVGEPVVAIGHPLGSKWTQTIGAISNNSYETFIQLNIALDQGNSGGPIINASGQVVGVATLVLRDPNAFFISKSATGQFGIRSDVLAELLDYYGIPYSTEPIIMPTATELEEQFRLLREERAALEAERKQIEAERLELERQRAEFQMKMEQARPFLVEYEQKREALLKLQREIAKREQEVLERERRLDARERRLMEKESALSEKLAEHFSLDLVVHPSYDVYNRQFVPLRIAAGLYYRFGFVRNEHDEVVRADKLGIMAMRQLGLAGWTQDEAALAIEFSGLVRLAVGAVIREPGQQSWGLFLPQLRYSASLFVDFIPSSPWIVGIGLNAQANHRFQWTAVAPGLLLGYELTFFRW